MAKRSMINCCVSGVPLPPYIKEWRRGAAKEGGAPKGGSPTPTGSRTPLFPIRSRRGKKEEGGRKERGDGPLPNSDWAWGGPPLLLSPPFH